MDCFGLMMIYVGCAVKYQWFGMMRDMMDTYRIAQNVILNGGLVK